MYDKLVNKEAKLAVIGLGYVGLPIALEFARKIKVVGFDINAERVEMMRNNVDPSNELEAEAFEGCDILFTADIEDLRDVDFYIVAVPTPIDESNLPDLRPLLGASKTVGQVLSKGNFKILRKLLEYLGPRFDIFPPDHGALESAKISSIGLTAYLK